MSKDIKGMLAQKLAENTSRHALAKQEVAFDYGKQHTKISLDLIDPNPFQPRCMFVQEEIDSLANSISENGLLQPITVRKIGERYQIITGERRFRAHQLLGRTSIEALVIQVEESEMAVLALAENVQRENLSDYEICMSLRKIEKLFPSKQRLAEALGMNREDMYKYFAFESLPPSIHEKLNCNPFLLSRTAAVDLKRVIQNTDRPTSFVETSLEKLWDLLEKGTLAQTKLAHRLQIELLAEAGREQKEEKGKVELVKNGKLVGAVTHDLKYFVIKIKKDSLSEKQREEIFQWINLMLSEKV